MAMARFEAVEVTAHQAFFLADYLGAGMYPWKLAITGPYVDPSERDPFNERCLAELTEAGVIDAQGRVKPSVAESVRTVCQANQWLEWLTVVDADQILRGVLARTSPPEVVVALRYAQMVTFTPLQLTHSEDVVPIISAGLPPDQPPAQFSEFELRMDIGKQIDERISRGADIVDTLTDLGIPERDAEIMETGPHRQSHHGGTDRTRRERRRSPPDRRQRQPHQHRGGPDPRQPAAGGASRGRHVCLHASRAVRHLHGGA